METLPDKTLIEIFSCLSETDLLSLTLTYSRFNDIIGTTSKLLRNFTITLDTNKPNLKYFGSRKYQKVIWNAKRSHFSEIFDKIGSSVRELRVNKLNDIKKFLNVYQKCPNLKKLYVDMVDGNEEVIKGDFQSIPRVFDELMINQFVNFIEIFKNSQVKNFAVKHSISRSKIDALRDLIMAQKSMERLDLVMPPHLFRSLFNSDHVKDVKFKLKHFGAIYINNFNSDMANYHKKFLTAHWDTLESMDCRNAALFTGLKAFKKLKRLNLSMVVAEDLVPLESVVELKINLRRSGAWSWKFPNVKKLEILAMPTLIEEANLLPKLEEITVNFNNGWNDQRYTFSRMVDLPKVKSIKIINFKPKQAFFTRYQHIYPLRNDHVHVKSPFECSYLQLDSLTLKNCHDFKFLIEILKNPKTQMKNLIIDGGKLKKSQRKLIEKAASRGKLTSDEAEKVNCFPGLWDYSMFLL